MLNTINPVLNLESRQLEDDWKVVKRMPIPVEIGAIQAAMRQVPAT
jgi:hypothetical protein